MFVLDDHHHQIIRDDVMFCQESRDFAFSFEILKFSSDLASNMLFSTGVSSTKSPQIVRYPFNKDALVELGRRGLINNIERKTKHKSKRLT